MARVFVDLDGVLADFDAGVSQLMGMSPKDYIELHGAPVFWKRLAHEPDFYANLPPIEGALDMLDEIYLMSPVTMILTGLPIGKWAEPQKRAWCEEHVGGAIPVICCMTRDKWQYATPGDILIDDRTEVRLDWEGAGGIFIHHVTAEATLAALTATLSV